ncbi:MAG: TolC family protein [Myxococcota bacterium]
MYAKLACAARIGVAALLLAGPAGALGNDCGNVDRTNLVSCAWRFSLRLASEMHAGTAARAREVAAAPILPSNPDIEVVAAQRRAPESARGLHWSAKLSQELELGGQRGLRRQEAAAGSSAQRERFAAARRDVAISAWDAYFEIAAAERAVRATQQVETVLHQVRDAAVAMAQGGVLSPADADLAEMAWARSRQALAASQREQTLALNRLALLVGGDGVADHLSVVSELTPIPGVEVVARRVLSANLDPPEVRALHAQGRAFATRARLLRRSRVPNVTLSAFIERDVVEGQLLGGAVSLPLPLPSPVGRTFNGEIAEAEALAAQAASEAKRVSRVNRAAVAQALAAYESRRIELELLPSEQARLAERNLEGLAGEVKLGRIAVRDALVAEQQLIEFLRARAEAEYAVCAASVRLAEVSNAPLAEEP